MKVEGVEITPTTQCKHWHSEKDVIAIKFKCCEKFFACNDCHSTLTTHESNQWSITERKEKAILCGRCKKLLTIQEYLDCKNCCTGCGCGFNPGCKLHYDLYFK